MPVCWQYWNGLEEVTEVTALWGEGIGRNSHTLKLQELGGLIRKTVMLHFHMISTYVTYLARLGTPFLTPNHIAFMLLVTCISYALHIIIVMHPLPGCPFNSDISGMSQLPASQKTSTTFCAYCRFRAAKSLTG